MSLASGGRSARIDKANAAPLLRQLQRNVVLGRRGAVFGGERQLGAAAAQVEVGVAPAVQFAGAAQGLARPRAVGVLAGVMHHQHGQVKLPLQFAQEGQQSRRFDEASFSSTRCSRIKGSRISKSGWIEARVLVRRWRSALRSSRKAGAVMTSMGKACKDSWAAAAMPSSRWRTTASESSAGKSKHRSLPTHGELPQTSCTGSDAQRHVQGQEAFAALGFAAEDADGFIGPQPFDEPLDLRAGGGQLAGPLYRQQLTGVHDALGASLSVAAGTRCRARLDVFGLDGRGLGRRRGDPSRAGQQIEQAGNAATGAGQQVDGGGARQGRCRPTCASPWTR